MAREILIIADKFELPDKKLVLVLVTGKDELRDAWQNASAESLKQMFTGKSIQIFGLDYQFKTNVLDVEVINSLADFKNVAVKIRNNTKSMKIEIDDEVEIDL